MNALLLSADACPRHMDFTVLTSLATLLLILPVQHAAAAVPDVPPGAIIYSRDVPTREAQNSGQPGTPHFVETAPPEIITGVLSSAMTSLSDEAAGQISASTGAAGVMTISILAGHDSPSNPESIVMTGLGGSVGGSGLGLANVMAQAIGQATGLIAPAVASVAIPMILGH